MMLSKKAKIVLICIVTILSMFICLNKVYAIEISPIEYTDEYKQWLELSDEDKENTIAPKMFNLDIKSNYYNIFSQARVLRNSLVDTKFDLRDIILDNLAIRNQGNTNACWAFATLSSLETNLAYNDYKNNKAGKVYDFSESHMDYSTSQSFNDGNIKNGFSRQVSEGGSFQTGSAYLTNGQGAVLENDMPFVSTKDNISKKDIENKKVVTKVTDTEEFSNFASSVELSALMVKMKEHIKENGSISAGIYGDISVSSDCYNNETGAIYCGDSSYKMNHNVSIIGWDDSYSRDNFNENNKPNRNGAWIIRNSWGTSRGGTHVGDNGFMYVSYEDVNIYTQLFGIELASEEIDYDNIYQYNELGYNGGILFNMPKVDIANVFDRDSSKGEALTEISLNVMQKVKCRVYINDKSDSKAIKDLQLVELKEGSTETFDAGYHTIEFKNPIILTGDKFVVVVEVEALDSQKIYCSTITKTNNNFWDNVEIKEKSSYASYGEYFENNLWLDTAVDAQTMQTSPCNFTIKAFTKEAELSTPTITPTDILVVTPTPTISSTPRITSGITPTPSRMPTNSPSIKPTEMVATPTVKPTSTYTTKPTTTSQASNSSKVGSVISSNNTIGTTTTNSKSLPYVGKTKLVLILILVLSINIIIVYKKYKKIY